MAVQNLQFPEEDIPYFEQRTQLEGVDYVFRFVFGERRQMWTFSMIGPDDEQVIGGQTIQVGVDLLRRSVARSKPPGLLIAVPLNEDDSPPGPTELGKRVLLQYWEASEFSAG